MRESVGGHRAGAAGKLPETTYTQTAASKPDKSRRWQQCLLNGDLWMGIWIRMETKTGETGTRGGQRPLAKDDEERLHRLKLTGNNTKTVRKAPF